MEEPADRYCHSRANGFPDLRPLFAIGMFLVCFQALTIHNSQSSQHDKYHPETKPNDTQYTRNVTIDRNMSTSLQLRPVVNTTLVLLTMSSPDREKRDAMKDYIDKLEKEFQDEYLQGPNPVKLSEAIPDPSSDLFAKTVASLSRPYHVYGVESKGHDKHDWCTPGSQGIEGLSRPLKGLLFAKTFKTASSAALGINYHMAHRVGRRKFTNETQGHKKHIACGTHLSHSMVLVKKLFDREQPSFLWTILRHPGKRALSAYNYFETGYRNKANETSMIDYISKQKNNMAVLLRQNRPIYLFGGRDVVQEIPNSIEYSTRLIEKEIMEIYDFIAVAERFEESLAVLSLLLHLEAGDVAMVQDKSKTKGSWSLKSSVGRPTCFWIPKSNVSDQNVEKYLNKEFQVGNLDFLLYEVANQSLDKTIKRLGADRVNRRVGEIRHLRDLVTTKCQHRIFPPCSDKGKLQLFRSRQDCYSKDFGCGQRCVNRVLDELR